jgi:predicted lysophospholipase L1 biosynthesis ABC-type transport system permease subunit
VSTTTANTIMVDQVQLARALAQAGVGGTLVNEWWLDVPDVTSAAYVDELAAAGVAGQSGAVLGTQVAQHPVRVATQGAIWLVALGAALIAALGFAIYATGSLRARNAEFAQLRAIGLSSRRLVGIVAVETTLLGLLGSIVGLGLGLALSLLVVPVVGVSANGAPPIPEVRILVPWDQLGLLAIEVGLVLMVVVVVAARVQRDIDPTTVLRRGD